jgi:hypothetical protein
MKWVGHVVCREQREIHTGFWWESEKERDPYEVEG